MNIMDQLFPCFFYNFVFLGNIFGVREEFMHRLLLLYLLSIMSNFQGFLFVVSSFLISLFTHF